MTQFAYPTSDVTVGSVWKLPVVFRSAASGAGTSLTLPAHQPGDIIIISARRAGSGTAPSLPAGWTNINTAANGSAVSVRAGYKIAASSSEVSGTWTNATDMVAVVYTSPAGAPLGGAATGAFTGAAATLLSLTMVVTDGTSALMGAIVTQATNITAAPAGYVVRAGASTPHEQADKLTATSDGTASTGVVTTGCDWHQEIKSAAANYFEAIDEVTQDDADYVFGNATTNFLEVALGAVTDPADSTGHIVHYAVRSFNGASGGETGKVELYQGGTLIAGSGNISLNRTAFTAGSFTLSGAQADAITDYSNLRLRFTGVALGAGEWYGVSWANLEVPDAGGAPQTITLTQVSGTLLGRTATKVLTLTKQATAAGLTAAGRTTASVEGPITVQATRAPATMSARSASTGGPQTKQATAVGASLAARAPSRVLGALTRQATVAAGTLSARAPAAVVGALSITAVRVAGSLSARTLTVVRGALAVQAVRVAGTLGARSATGVMGPLTVQAVRVAGALMPRVITAVPGPITKQASRVPATLSARVSTSGASLSRTLGVVPLVAVARTSTRVLGALPVPLVRVAGTLSGRTVTAVPGALAVTLIRVPATVTARAPTRAMGALTRQLVRQQATLVARVAVIPAGAQNIGTQRVAATLSARALSRVAGPINVSAIRAALVLTPRPLLAAPGSIARTLGTAPLTAVARGLSTIVGPTTVVLTQAQVSLLARPINRTLGTITVVLGGQALTLTAWALTRIGGTIEITAWLSMQPSILLRLSLSPAVIAALTAEAQILTHLMVRPDIAVDLGAEETV